MAADFTIKKGDLLPTLAIQCLDASGSPVDLTGATVVFRMRTEGAAAPKVNAAASLDDAAQGLVSYAWEAADVDTAGKFRGEFAITLAGKVETVPAGGYLSILIVDTLG